MVFNFDIFSDRKVNLLGTFEGSKLKIPSNFRKRREKIKMFTQKFTRGGARGA